MVLIASPLVPDRLVKVSLPALVTPSLRITGVLFVADCLSSRYNVLMLLTAVSGVFKLLKKPPDVTISLATAPSLVILTALHKSSVLGFNLPAMSENNAASDLPYKVPSLRLYFLRLPDQTAVDLPTSACKIG